MFSNSLKIRKGDILSCKYPKHGRLNILCSHVGKVEGGGVGPGGTYLTIRNVQGVCRSLSLDKMIEPTKV